MRIYFTMLLLFIIATAFPQKRNAIWCFGDSAGIDFSNPQSPTTFTSVVNARGSCTSIADTSGNLLFYAHNFYLDFWLTGRYPEGVVRTKNHQTMMNGDSIVGSLDYHDMTIVPFPGNDSLFYLFTVIYYGGTANTYKGFYYTLINMNKDNGNGKVMDKNHFLANPTTVGSIDAVAAVKHGNGRDWWVIFRPYDYTNGNNTFYKYLVTPSGVSGPFTQSIGQLNHCYFSTMKFSQDGTKFVFATLQRIIEVYDFDRCTGNFNSPVIISNEVLSNNSSHFWGIEFSPNNQYLYASSGDTVSYLYQYDLLAANVPASKIIIDSLSAPAFPGQLALAPDNKIYWTAFYYPPNVSFYFPYPDSLHSIYNENLSVINSPDSGGTACNFTPFSFYLGGNRTYWGLPNNPNYDLGPDSGSVCDTITGMSNQLHQVLELLLYPNPVKDELQVKNSMFGEKNVMLKVYDVLGQKVYTTNSATKDFKLQTSNFSNGVYFLEITDGKKSARAKFVKQ